MRIRKRMKPEFLVIFSIKNEYDILIIYEKQKGTESGVVYQFSLKFSRDRYSSPIIVADLARVCLIEGLNVCSR